MQFYLNGFREACFVHGMLLRDYDKVGTDTISFFDSPGFPVQLLSFVRVWSCIQINQGVSPGSWENKFIMFLNLMFLPAAASYNAAHVPVHKTIRASVTVLLTPKPMPLSL